MSGIEVDKGVLDAIAGDLDRAARGLEDLAGGVPAGVDAGPMTAVVAAMLGQVVGSSGNVSTAMAASADGVRLARRYYERSDADSAAGLEQIRQAMRP